MVISIGSKRGLFGLILTIDDKQPLETAYGPFIDNINTLIKYSVENQDFDTISLVEEVIANIAKEKLKRM